MLYLRELAQQGMQQKCVIIEERLPAFLASPCQLNVTYQVEDKRNHYLINLTVEGQLTVSCQRCMQEFELPYSNATVIAVARSDERAEQLLEHYESMVSSNGKVSLEELISDELHLYVPQFHEEIKDCDQEINQFLTENFESN